MTGSFYDWLILQVRRSDTVGQFARLAKRDKLFPRRAKRLHIFLLRYETSYDTRSMVKKAHAEWRRSRNEMAA